MKRLSPKSILLIILFATLSSCNNSKRAAKIYFDKGVLEQDMLKYKEAINEFSSSIKLDSNYAEAYNGRGLAHSNIENYDEAIRDFTKAIKLDPDNAKAYINRGLIYMHLKRLQCCG